MPNTLAHIGAQGLLNHLGKPGIDPKLVCLGCLLPDIPWIFQRLVSILLPSSDPYSLRLYCIAQASLFVTLLLCGAIASLSNAPRSIFVILSVNATLHLLLDALQTKWANGVHLFAPLSWDICNVGLFWPESFITYLLTVGGLGYIAWQWKQGVNQPIPIFPIAPFKAVLSVILLILYFVFPFGFMDGALQANNHFVKTLEEKHARAGQKLELDRATYVNRPESDMVRTFAGENILLTKEILDHSGPVSIKGHFVDSTNLEIVHIHEHSGWFRVSSTLLGILLLSAMWLSAARKQFRLMKQNK